MIKRNKKIFSVVAIFALIAVLGSTAAIFVGTRTDDNEQETITSPVGYLDGTTPGNGEYVKDPATWVFAENDSSIFTNITYVTQNLAKDKKLGLYQTTYGGDPATQSSANLVSDVNGNGYVELSNPNSGTSAAVLVTQSLNGIQSYTGRAGTYVAEFDIMIPYEVSVNISSGSSDYWFMSLALSNLNWGNQSDFSRIFFYDSDIEGYYSIGNSDNTVNSKEIVKFKYGEWYRFRVEYKLDNTSTRYSCNVTVNDVDVWSFTTHYWAETYSSINKGYGPTYFRFVTRGYANGLKVGVDNLFFGRIIK